jgi:hypothetical protein
MSSLPVHWFGLVQSAYRYYIIRDCLDEKYCNKNIKTFATQDKSEYVLFDRSFFPRIFEVGDSRSPPFSLLLWRYALKTLPSSYNIERDRTSLSPNQGHVKLVISNYN